MIADCRQRLPVSSFGFTLSLSNCGCLGGNGGVNTTRHELRIRCLAAALEAVKGDRPGGLFVALIGKGSRGDWSTVSDAHHEPAKRWLRRLETPAFSRPPPLFDDAPQPPSSLAAALGSLVTSIERPP